MVLADQKEKDKKGSISKPERQVELCKLIQQNPAPKIHKAYKNKTEERYLSQFI